MESTELIKSKENGKATAGMVLGIVGLFVWFIPIIGLPVNIVGLVMGIKGLKSEKTGKAKAAIIMSIIGLLLSIGNAVLGAIVGYNMAK